MWCACDARTIGRIWCPGGGGGAYPYNQMQLTQSVGAELRGIPVGGSAGLDTTIRGQLSVLSLPLICYLCSTGVRPTRVSHARRACHMGGLNFLKRVSTNAWPHKRKQACQGPGLALGASTPPLPPTDGYLGRWADHDTVLHCPKTAKCHISTMVALQPSQSHHRMKLPHVPSF